MIYDIRYLFILGVVMLLSWLAGANLKRKFALYQRVAMNLSGKEIAERMLAENGIYDVQVVSTPGKLTDHYNPRDKTVNLSQVVCHERTLSAAAVAAHECGHAIQHSKAYGALQMRSAIVPMVSITSRIQQFVIIGGLILLTMGSWLGIYVAWAGVIMFGLTALFSLITLPVEFDASKRALVWLEKSGMAFGEQQSMAKDALNAAAMTYVVGALASLAHLGYWLMVVLGRQRQ